MKPVHAKRFAGHVGIDTLGGPEVIEEYEPLCGTIGDDLLMTSGRDWKDEGATCKKCLAIIKKGSAAEATEPSCSTVEREPATKHTPAE